MFNSMMDEIRIRDGHGMGRGDLHLYDYVYNYELRIISIIYTE